MKARKCAGCGRDFVPAHKRHFWHDYGCYASHFDREHPTNTLAKGMGPLGLLGDRKIIEAFVKKHGKVRFA